MNDTIFVVDRHGGFWGSIRGCLLPNAARKNRIVRGALHDGRCGVGGSISAALE
jgi:hypothetical protein